MDGPSNALIEPKDCDIVVAGAGMSGLSAALVAAGHDADVVVLEADTAAGGSGR